jgi:hypothetical protein
MQKLACSAAGAAPELAHQLQQSVQADFISNISHQPSAISQQQHIREWL